MSKAKQTIEHDNDQGDSPQLSSVTGGSEADKLMQKNRQYFQDILLRLSFAANGWDEQLDKVLASLQDDLRTNTRFPDLKRISEQLYRFLMQANANRPAQAAQMSQLLSGFLNDLHFPEQLQGDWDAVVDRAQEARSKEQIADTLEACLPLLNQAMQGGQTQQTARKNRGVFSTLFGGAEETTPHDGKLITRINEKLFELLEDLNVPTELEGQVERLRQILAGKLELAKIPEVIGDINDLIHGIRGVVNKERKGLEEFLGQLMSRLSLIDGALEESNSSNQAINECHHKLEEEIQEQTSHIETQAKTATDLNQLKSMVQQRVDAIRNHMDEFQTQEQQLLKAAEEKMEQLVQRLNEVEEETDHLRQKVSEHSLQALNDTLTGVPNRHAYEERLQQEFARWKRYHQPLSIMVVDIDKFKHINDNFGHRAGDKALKIIAGQLQKMTRETDMIARYGGDEFVLLLPETDTKGAMAIAEKLRDGVERCAFHFRDKKVTITVSCGISEYRKDDTPEDAFERADQALYKSKHKGRNQFTSG